MYVPNVVNLITLDTQVFIFKTSLIGKSKKPRIQLVSIIVSGLRTCIVYKFEFLLTVTILFDVNRFNSWSINIPHALEY